MIQVCDPPRTRQVRRLSAEEFCRLAQSEVSSVYRPRSEVLRMLTVGEVWGVYSTRGVPGAGCILLPMDADVAAAAALRRFLGWNRTSGGYFLTPALLHQIADQNGGKTWNQCIEVPEAKERQLQHPRPF